MLCCHTENVKARKSLKSGNSSCIDSGWESRPLTLELSKFSSPPQTQNAEHKPAIYTGNNFAELLTNSVTESPVFLQFNFASSHINFSTTDDNAGLVMENKR